MDRPSGGEPAYRARRNDATGYTERPGQAPPYSQQAQQQRQWQQPQQQWQQQQQQQSPERMAQRPAMQRQMAGQPSSSAAGGPSQPPSSSRIPVMKPQQNGVPISRPTPAAQWPLGGSINTGAGSAEPYRPPAGRSQAPQRPPRPSVVPSILDSSKIQDPTPTVFAYNNFPPPPVPANTAGLPVPSYEPDWNQQSSSSSPSRPSTISSVGSIPDFPVPVVVPGPSAIPVPPPVAAMPAPRRSVTLGPPPSARRGASSFYSTVSYVSPIPEESPRSRSHASLASSAAMPENWGGSASSVIASPYYPDGTAYYENIPEERGMGPFFDGDSSESGAGSVDGDHDGDEKQLVRSASIGKRTKASLVTTGTAVASTPSVSTDAAPKTDIGSAITVGGVLNAYNAATAPDPTNPTRRSSVSPPSGAGDGRPDTDVAGLSRSYSRLSAIRRPPRLDIDAVRNAEARGSLTSLPDLIRRATRLAASLENGRRPASQVDNFSMSPGMYEKAMNESSEKHQSGLSDMLAAFPPPAHANRPSFRQSLRNQIGSWPIPMHGGRFGGQPPIRERLDEDGDSELNNGRKREGRRCCGLPLWGFLLLMLIVLVIVAAAIVIPIEFFVIRKQKPNDSNALAQCKTQLTCANGGSITVSAQGTCSCICINDFTGTDCSIAGARGCTTATVTSASDSKSVSDVTLGAAMPRLLEQAQQNYSIPLVGTEIVALLNAGNLSCAAENALVTFDGEMERQKSGSSEVSIFQVVKGAAVADSVLVVTETVQATPVAGRVKRDDGDGVLITAGGSTSASSATPVVILPSSTTTTTTTVTPSGTSTSTSTGTGTGTATATSSAAGASATFTVTEEVLDFARVAVLFILQEQESLANAESAQSTLQRFFTMASAGKAKQGDGVTEAEARNITLSGGNSINLVDYQVSAGTTLSGVGVAGR